MGMRDSRRQQGTHAALPIRAGSFLTGWLPTGVSLVLMLAVAQVALAEDTAKGGMGMGAGASSGAATSSDSMKKMMDQQLDRIPSGEAGVDQIMGELTKGLTLTPEQQKDIRPTIVNTVASMEKSRDSFKAGEITPMAMAMQVQMAGQKAAVLIEPILDEDQMVKYKAMRQAQRRQMMQAMQAQRAQGAPAGASGGGSQ
jgi:hypothetical protein